MPYVAFVIAALVAALTAIPGPGAMTPSPLHTPPLIKQPVVAHTSFYKRITPITRVVRLPNNVVEIVGVSGGAERSVILHLAAPPRARDVQFAPSAKLLGVVSTGSQVRVRYSEDGQVRTRTYRLLTRGFTVQTLKRSAP